MSCGGAVWRRRSAGFARRQRAIVMRRILAIVGVGCVVVLLCSAALFVASTADDDFVPPGATHLRLDSHSMSRLRISYYAPPSWSLLALFAFMEEHGWSRDPLWERSLQRPWAPDPTMTFAIYSRQSLFGLVSEVAIISIASEDRARLQVRLLRCIGGRPWIACP